MAPSDSLNILCPKCGHWVTKLKSTTGWCASCSSGLDSYSYHDDIEQYLEIHADELEHYINLGYTFRQALQRVAISQRPICLCCGEVIYRAPKNSLFCSKTEKCRQVSNRYKYLVKQKNVDKPYALHIVLQELSEAA